MQKISAPCIEVILDIKERLETKPKGCEEIKWSFRRRIHIN